MNIDGWGVDLFKAMGDGKGELAGMDLHVPS